MVYKKIAVSDSHFVAFASIDYKQEAKLFSFVREKNLEKNRLNHFKNPKRKVEWMSVRYLLNLLLSDFQDVQYHSNGKPFFKDSNDHLSISHSHERIAVSVSKHYPTAVDIQLITPKIKRIKNKFLNPSELDLIDENNETELTYLWSLKEALFKIDGNQELFLKPNFLIESINSKDKTILAKAKIINGDQVSSYQLHVEMINNYVLAYLLNS